MLIKNVVATAMFSLLLMAGSAWAGGDVAKGKELAADCADCHGEDFKGDEDVTGLAGKDAASLVAEMKKFKTGERVDEDEMMKDYVADLSDQDMEDLAAYFASLPK